VDTVVTKKHRPKVLDSITEEVTTGCGHLYLTMGYDHEGALLEIFIHLGKTGGCSHCQLEALSRCISLGLKHGVPIEQYKKQLLGLSCPKSVPFPKDRRILSCADGVAKVLALFPERLAEVKNNGHFGQSNAENMQPAP